MDDSQSDTLNLLDFINAKCNEDDAIENKKLIYLYAKCIRNAIVSTYDEQKDINYSLSCSDLISNIFKIIYKYSLNIKLTIFMCERCTLLFNEYLNISNSYGSDKVNLLDVKQFIINKSIGPIITNNNNPNVLNEHSLTMIILKNLLSKAAIKKVREDHECVFNLNDFLENITCILVNSISNIYQLGYDNFIQNKIDNLFTHDILDFPREVNLLKIYFEVFLYCHNSQKLDYTTSKTIAEKTIVNRINFIDQNIELNDFFNCSEPIHDKYFFLNLINEIKTSLT